MWFDIAWGPTLFVARPHREDLMHSFVLPPGPTSMAMICSSPSLCIPGCGVHTELTAGRRIPTRHLLATWWSRSGDAASHAGRTGRCGLPKISASRSAWVAGRLPVAHRDADEWLSTVGAWHPAMNIVGQWVHTPYCYRRVGRLVQASAARAEWVNSTVAARSWSMEFRGVEYPTRVRAIPRGQFTRRSRP